MAFTSTTVWEVETGGSDSNGGGFDTGVAGFPNDGAATSATGNSPVFSSASYTFVAGDVGAFIYIKAGTNWTPGWYPIASVSAGAATLNAAIGSAATRATSQPVTSAPNTVAGCATTASPSGATWGIDYSQQGGVKIAYTDMVIGVTTTTYTSVANPVGKNLVGNIINVVSGSGFVVQRVAVVSTSTITATCDKTLGTTGSTGGNGNLGGALASPGAAGLVAPANNNTVYVKSGAYSITSASNNVSGGCFSPGTLLWLEGYGTVRGDLGTPPVFTASGISTFTIVALASQSVGRNVTVDCAGLTASRGFSMESGIYYKLFAKNCTNNGFISLSEDPFLLMCYATGCSSQPAFKDIGLTFACEAYNNTITGFQVGINGVAYACLSYGNSGASSDGFAPATGGRCVGCVAYGNGRDGFRQTNTFTVSLNCIAESNTGVGFNATGGNSTVANCAAYSNTGGNLGSLGDRSISLANITGTGSFFVNAAGGNFALNNTAGAGAAARAAGLPGTFPTGTTIGYQDIGVQHQDSGGGSVISVGVHNTVIVNRFGVAGY